jgi:hypothetical protein
MRDGIAVQALERLAKIADLVLAKTRLPPLLDVQDQPMVGVLGNSPFWSEPEDLHPAADRFRLDDGQAALLETTQRHSNRFLRHPR